MSDTTIEWTDTTWNPVAGCSVISDGCKNCYAMRMAHRLSCMGVEKYAGLTRKSGGRHKWNGVVRCDEKALLIPLTWKKPRKVFVNSMSDLFHEGVPANFIAKVWSTMEKSNQHIFQILTKRPERMREIIRENKLKALPNVWLGTSVENSEVLSRIDALQDIQCAVRFISFEPLIGSCGDVSLDGIDWAIVGGESGPGARELQSEWVGEIQEACEASGTSFFFKQWGGRNKKKSGRSYRGKTWDAFPEARII